MDRNKPSLKGLAAKQMFEALAPLSPRPYQARQIMDWFYKKGVSDFSAMTDLPSAFREGLAVRFRGDELSVVSQRSSIDGTRKLLLGCGDGQAVEAVLIPGVGRLTACLSTQAGCGLGCLFCATGGLGLARDLSVAEIADQLFQLQRLAGGQRISNVVFMGMGEPLLNYDAVLAAARLINAAGGFGIGARRITISTAGIVPGIMRLAREPEQFKLAVSLNAADNRTRTQLMPVNRKYPVPALLEAVREYARARGKLVTFEYVLLAGVNDRPADADGLGRLLRGIPSKVNLISYNQCPGINEYQASTASTIREFHDRLARSHPAVTIRQSLGGDIAAACGQLRVENTTKRGTT